MRHQFAVKRGIDNNQPRLRGNVIEREELCHGPRRSCHADAIHLCDVTDGRISRVTTYCNGGWDAALRERHAAEAPMVQP